MMGFFTSGKQPTIEILYRGGLFVLVLSKLSIALRKYFPEQGKCKVSLKDWHADKTSAKSDVTR